ncbi:GntR family transcriptional regulator [Paraburkholderia fungorum]|uniref:GntR family transcriptional regulator n=1 Tax=Paraburkholderia fungorum TaxID=134537 RepID=UPI0011C37522|nr:GntR family transcriptional regulator [Paraburkholderia fungorum]
MAEIRQRIRRGDLAPGQRLVAAELSTQLAISGGPIREALTRLAGEGLIDIQPHRGAIVRTQSQEDVVEIFQLREVVEGLAARLAARAVADGTGDAGAMLDAARDCHAMAGSMDFFGYAKANQAFHAAIYELAGSARVTALARQLSDQIDRLNNLRLGRASVLVQSSEEHDEIATAIAAGDEEGAESSMRQHVIGSMKKVIGTA